MPVDKKSTHFQDSQLSLGIRLRDDATLQSFYPGKNIQALAHVAFLATGRTPDSVAQDFKFKNETFIYLFGESGVGRTHLLQGACLSAVSMGKRAQYLPLKSHLLKTPDMLIGLEYLDLVCLDDIEDIAGNPVWEEALFHFFNRMRDMGTPLIIAGNAAVRELDIRLPDLKSRLGWGISYQLYALTEEEMLNALQLRAKIRGITLSEDVGRFLLRRFDRNMSSLYETLDTLDDASMRAQRRLTIPFVKEVLDV